MVYLHSLERGVENKDARHGDFSINMTRPPEKPRTNNSKNIRGWQSVTH